MENEPKNQDNQENIIEEEMLDSKASLILNSNGELDNLLNSIKDLYDTNKNDQYRDELDTFLSTIREIKSKSIEIKSNKHKIYKSKRGTVITEDNANFAIQKIDELLIELNLDKVLVQQNNSNESDSQNNEGTEKSNTKFKKIFLSDKLSLAKIFILNQNKELKDAILEAIRDYNNSIDNEEDESIINDNFKKVEKLRKKWIKFRDKYENTRNTDTKNIVKTKTLNQDKILDDRYIDDYDIINQYIHKSQKHDSIDNIDTKSTGTQNQTESTEGINTDNKELSIEEMIILEDDVNTIDIEAIENDKEFNDWISFIYNILKRKGENTSKNSKKINEWFNIYQRSYGRYRILKSVLDEIKPTENKTQNQDNNISIFYIEEIIYKIYKNPYSIGIEKIIKIENLYNKTKEDKEKIEKLRKNQQVLNSLKDDDGNLKQDKIKTEHVKQIFESDGLENKKSNIDDMLDFLINIRDNYDAYTQGIESESGGENMTRVYKKYRENKLENEIVTGKKQKFLKFFKDIKTNLSEPTTEERNGFIPLIREVRKLNLVNRLDRNNKKILENKERMNSLIDFIKDPNNLDLLIKVIDNSYNKDDSNITPEVLEKIKLFESMYKIFTQCKYESKKSRDIALDRIQNVDQDLESATSDQKTFEQMLDETHIFEMEEIERLSTYESIKDDFKEIESDIDKTTKSTEKEKEKEKKSKIQNLNQRFSELKIKLENLANESQQELPEYGKTQLLIKKIEIKLTEAVVKYIDKTDYKEIRKADQIYKNILNSNEFDNQTKRKYIQEFLEALEEHRKNKNNGVLQNIMLDGIIKDYKDKLSKIQQ